MWPRSLRSGDIKTGRKRSAKSLASERASRNEVVKTKSLRGQRERIRCTVAKHVAVQRDRRGPSRYLHCRIREISKAVLGIAIAFLCPKDVAV